MPCVKNVLDDLKLLAMLGETNLFSLLSTYNKLNGLLQEKTGI